MADAAVDVVPRIEGIPDTQGRRRRGHELHQALRAAAGDGARVELGLGFDDGGDEVFGNGVSACRLLDMRVERSVGDANVRRHVPEDERQEKNAKAEYAPSQASISHGEMESQIRYRIQRPAISTTYTLRGQEPAGEFLIASGRRLHGLQEAQDPTIASLFRISFHGGIAFALRPRVTAF